MTRIDEALSKRRILITCGTGGVGKTTLSAAIAFRSAILGKRTVVVTIDPAKRLATSLGMKALGDDPTDLTDLLKQAAKKAGYTKPITGTIEAIMPDTRKTFETFIQELAPNPQVAERVMKNPIFQIFAKEFSGTNEYMAMEKLYRLEQTGKYDCIILDTPPSRNTLAFLEAPKLLARFFEDRLIRWLVLPTNRLFSAGMRTALGLLEKLTGAGFMTSLLEFASALFEVQANFTANLKKIIRLLESENVGFLMVTVPAPDVVPEVIKFIEVLENHHFHFDGLALNRTLSYLRSHSPVPADLANQVIQALREREHRVLKALEQHSIALSAQLPELARDVHSVEDLFHVAMAFDSSDSSVDARNGGNLQHTITH